MGAPLAATLGASGGRVFAMVLPPQGEDQFENPHFIRYDSSCFTINDKDTFIFSAAFHYPRCPRELWRDRLQKLKRAGFNTIETYVFWNYHEPVEGQVNLSEFEDFIKLVHEMKFWMIARPGPYVCAEWDAGGFPHWVIAKRFPLRSNAPQSLQTSDHWYKQVLPVISRNQVTMGGPIIMLQVENEYDYCPKLSNAERKAYVSGLAEMAWTGAIDVPIITCWTKQARENTDLEMARIMDTCNFYPRWNIVKEVPPALAKLRKEETTSPLGITELQGGWFSEFGGKLSVDQEGVNGAQLNALSKTVMEQGVTYFNYYMAFGGTNFDWAGKKLTTTYDYAAPLREPGGLWEKYYAARGIGASLGLFGNVLTRAQIPEVPATSSEKNVSVTARVNGKSGVVFVRENANAEQKYKMTFRDPNSPTNRVITVPREGELTIGAREMKMLPVQVPIPGGQIRYTTAELLAHGVNRDEQYVILYDEPGRLVEIGLATLKEPHVEGETVYQYWDPEYESVVVGVKIAETEKILFLNGHILVVLLPRQRALQTWTGEFSPKIIPGSDETKPYSVPFISDIAMMVGTGVTKKTNWAEMEYAPGEHALTLLLPPVPTHCSVDGEPAPFQYDRHWHTARLHITTPAPPSHSFPLSEIETWVEKFDPAAGQWLTTPLRALEDLGPLPYGYVKYRTQFTASGQPKMFISTVADDAKKVFLNGKFVTEASNSKRQTEIPLAGYAQAGANTLEIIYELFGSPNFGENLGELKGIESVRLGADAQSATAIDSWQVQRFPAPMKGREVDPAFAPGAQTVALSVIESAKEPVPAFTWCRASFNLEKPPAEWSLAWKLTFEAAHDALLYLNGKFVGRYMTIGPQKEFYLPEPYLIFDSKRKNVLSIVLAYTTEPRSIRTLRVGPYEEFATRRTRVEFGW
jgi:Glycosyl hydrolases family 35/Beta-galactosidase, domain 2/Beta-galactosidase, galactose-binding domain/Beta-galactosidase, first all-beta domain